jgi:hypothetical protein
LYFLFPPTHTLISCVLWPARVTPARVSAVFFLRQVRDWALQASPAVYAPLSISSEMQLHQGSGDGSSQADESSSITVVDAVGFPEFGNAVLCGGASWPLSRSRGLPNSEGGSSSLRRRGSVEFVPWSVVAGDEQLLQRVKWADLKGEERALEKVHRFF